MNLTAWIRDRLDEGPASRWPLQLVAALLLLAVLTGWAVPILLPVMVGMVLSLAVLLVGIAVIVFGYRAYRTRGLLLAGVAFLLFPLIRSLLGPQLRIVTGSTHFNILSQSIAAVGSILVLTALIYLSIEVVCGIYSQGVRSLSTESIDVVPPLNTIVQRWPAAVMVITAALVLTTSYHFWTATQVHASLALSAAQAAATLAAGGVIFFVVLLWLHYRTTGLTWLALGMVVLPLAYLVVAPSFLEPLRQDMSLVDWHMTVTYTRMAVTSGFLLLAICYLLLEVRSGTYTPGGGTEGKAGNRLEGMMSR